MYKTRRDWLLAEMLLGIVSLATGLSSLTAGGVLSEALWIAGLGPQSWCFVFSVTGVGLLTTAILESFSRSHGAERKSLCYYAQCRMWWHFFNGLCWLYAFTSLVQLYVERDVLIAPILFQALPLLAFNIWGVVEHAKALWFDTERAGTASLVRAVGERVRNSNSAANSSGPG